MQNPSPCPCGSQKLHAECCEPYLTGQALAPTAEALMRSRYSAFSTGNVDYLIETSHPSKRETTDRVDILQTIQSTRWLGLQVLAVQKGGMKDQRGIVEFVAMYQVQEFLATPQQLHERSRFIKERGRWFYLDGDMLPPVKL